MGRKTNKHDAVLRESRDRRDTARFKASEAHAAWQTAEAVAFALSDAHDKLEASLKRAVAQGGNGAGKSSSSAQGASKKSSSKSASKKESAQSTLVDAENVLSAPLDGSEVSG